MQLSMALTARPQATTTTTSARASLRGAKSKSTQRATTITLITRSPRLASASARRRRPRLASVAAAASGGDDATGAWLDLASFVAGSSGNKGGGPYDELADAIGKAAYVDVQGWHVYLSDVKVGGAPLAGILAGELGPLAAGGQGGKALSPATVDEFLARVPLKLGGGKATVSLLDSIPSFALGDLHRAVDDWSRNGGR